MKKALFYLFMFIVVQCVVLYATQGVLYIVKGQNFGMPSGTFLVGTAIAYNILTIILFYALKWARPATEYVRSKPWAQLFWVSLAAIGVLLPSAWLQEQMPDLPNWAEQQLGDIIKTTGGYLAIAILAPLAEEVVFRGAILRVLLERFCGPHWTSTTAADNKRHWLAIIISALLFAAVHMNPAQMPHAFLVGLLLGWLFYRTGSILPGILFHIVNNTAAFVMLKLYADHEDVTLLELFGGNERSVTLSVIFSLFILLPSLYQLSWRLKR